MNAGQARRQWHLPVTRPADAPELLSATTGLSRGHIKRLMAQGAVWLERNGAVRRLRRAGRLLQPGDRLHLYQDPAIEAATPPPARLLADHGHWSLWYKPAGLFSHGSRWGDHWSVVRAAERTLGRNAQLVHRLDRAANGLMLLAHGRPAARTLAERFRRRELEKHYLAVVEGDFPSSPLECTASLDGRAARTRARLARRAGGRSLLAVEIFTGRKHQIRRHLAAAGWPLVGDRLYGRGGDEDLQLQAARLCFELENKWLDLRLPLDLRLWQVSDRLLGWD